jgi:Flp pilus assembly protein TadG
MTIQTNKKSIRSRQQGIAIVEFVICLPIVLFMILAVAEFGNGIRQYNALTQQVRDGARYLTVAAKTGTTGSYAVTGIIATEVSNLVAYGSIGPGAPRLPGLSAANVNVQDLGDRQVSVRADYPYQPLLIGGIPNLGNTGAKSAVFTMSAEVVMRVL